MKGYRTLPRSIYSCFCCDGSSRFLFIAWCSTFQDPKKHSDNDVTILYLEQISRVFANQLAIYSYRLLNLILILKAMLLMID